MTFLRWSCFRGRFIRRKNKKGAPKYSEISAAPFRHKKWTLWEEGEPSVPPGWAECSPETGAPTQTHFAIWQEIYFGFSGNIWHEALLLYPDGTCGQRRRNPRNYFKNVTRLELPTSQRWHRCWVDEQCRMNVNDSLFLIY